MRATVSVGRAVSAYLVAGLVVLSATGAVLAELQRRQAVTEAVRDARSLTSVMAHAVVAPELTDAMLSAGKPRDALDTLVRERVLGQAIVRVKLWDARGRIVYSDDTTAVDRVFPLPADERRALTQQGPALAEVSTLDQPENAGEQQFGTLLQVYLGVHTQEGTPLLFETYQAYDSIRASSRRTWTASLPVLLGGLVLLYVLQAPLAYRMARRLQISQEEREGLLVSSLAASDRERASIAADLHDGVVQGLVGASYSLAAAAARQRDVDVDTSSFLASTAADLRRWVRELRSLVVTITPPALHAQGLAVSLGDLAATLELRGLTVTVLVEGVEGLGETAEALTFRAAQEAVRNIVRHADAHAVTIGVEVTLDRESGQRLVLRVTDDGRGLMPSQRDARRRGSVGLDLLGSLVAAHGGSVTVEARAPRGTLFTMTLPVSAVPSPLPQPERSPSWRPRVGS